MLPWQRAGVVAGVGEGVAAGVAQHVDVDRKGHLARAPMRLMSRFTAAEVKRPPRSVANTNAEFGSSSRRAVTSSPRSG